MKLTLSGSLLNFKSYVAAIVLLSICLVSACTTSIGHPSQYSDTNKSRENCEDQDRTQEFFTNDDIELIKKRGIPVELTGAGSTIKSPDQTGLEMIHMAKDIDPADPVVWAALIYKELELFGDGSSSVIKDTDIQSDLDEFEALIPDNSLPVILRSYLYTVTNDLAKASEEIKNASHKKVFSTYVLEMMKYSIVAGESVAHSPLAAREFGISGNERVLFIFYKLSMSLLKYELVDLETIKACLVMGEQLEIENNTLFGQLIGIAIQSKSIQMLNDKDKSEELRSIEEKHDHIRTIYEKSKEIDFDNLSEDRLIRYFDDIFTIGEEEAIKKLYSELKEDHGTDTRGND